jgi:hypothetical protein
MSEPHKLPHHYCIKPKPHLDSTATILYIMYKWIIIKKKTLNATAQKYLFCSCVNNQNTQKYWSDIFRPIDKASGKTSVALLACADKKLRINCVCNIEKIVLFLSKYHSESNNLLTIYHQKHYVLPNTLSLWSKISLLVITSYLNTHLTWLGKPDLCNPETH